MKPLNRTSFGNFFYIWNTHVKQGCILFTLRLDFHEVILRLIKQLVYYQENKSNRNIFTFVYTFQ
jgi:hypothetical protein